MGAKLAERELIYFLYTAVDKCNPLDIILSLTTLKSIIMQRLKTYLRETMRKERDETFLVRQHPGRVDNGYNQRLHACCQIY